ncbi:MAG: response regulator [Candidatus Omnitrophica bacterium]|nr:response regulator [Candidatus Omnitrophota bacterium]
MNPKILIVDRSEHFCELIRVRLLNYGFDRFVLAQAGREALALYTQEQPQIVLVEMGLEDVSGLELCRRIKQEAGDTVKVIVMSGLAEPNQTDEAKEAGADAYAVKAFDCVEIIINIKRQVAGAQTAV